MKKILKYLTFFIILLLAFTTANCQKKSYAKKSKSSSIQKIKPQVFKSEEEMYKWIYEDSVKMSKLDSINWIKDSVAMEVSNRKSEEEFSKLYQENWYPKDSLSYVDDIVEKIITANVNIDADSAVFLITKRFARPLQKARAIFFWIASTVKYDYYLYSNNLVQPIFDTNLDAQYTFKTKKGVCQNYANLYRYMCDKVGLECKSISGWGKNFPICINPEGEKNHAWNVVKINKKWVLLDATWATIDTSNRVDAYWFNTPPEQFIYSHLPEDSTFQLLNKKFTKKIFLNFPIVSDFLFKSKLDFEIPEQGSFILNNSRFTISVPIEEKSYTIDYSIIPYKGNDPISYSSNVDRQNLVTKTIVDKKNRNLDYEVEIPSKGIWWLSVTLNKKIKNKNRSEVLFPEVIMFKITY
jgi:transglutaminase/protease-like cytokinesis protein 3